MTKALLFLLIVVSQAALAVPVPPSPSGQFEPGASVRMFKDLGEFTAMAEVTAAHESDRREYKNTLLGGYLRLSDSWSAGLFYRRAYGLRHDDDWFNDSGIWNWRDTNSRGEDFAVADLTYKHLLSEKWVGEVKVRELNDFFNGQSTLMARPGVTYFWLHDDQPFINIFMQLELDWALNYGSRTNVERWGYVGALYRLASQLDVGGFFALRWQEWRTSSVYIAKGGAPYSASETAEVLQALAIFHY